MAPTCAPEAAGQSPAALFDLGGAEGVEVAPSAEQTAERLLAEAAEDDGEGLARTLVSAAMRLHERDSVLWLLVRGFHTIAHQNQCALVMKVIQGFAHLSSEEQAALVSAVGPRVRCARRGWKCHRSAPNGEALRPLVGVQGRKEADPVVIEFLDTVTAVLGRLTDNHRARLHRRLDVAVSRELSPGLLAAMMAKLPEDDVAMLQEWLVEEEALPDEAAQKVVGTLLSAGQAAALPGELAAQASEVASQASDAALDAGRRLSDSVASGAGAASDALWRLSEELAEGGVEYLPEWLQGRAPSPTPSLVYQSSNDERRSSKRNGPTRASYSPGRRSTSSRASEGGGSRGSVDRGAFRVSISSRDGLAGDPGVASSATPSTTSTDGPRQKRVSIYCDPGSFLCNSVAPIAHRRASADGYPAMRVSQATVSAPPGVAGAAARLADGDRRSSLGSALGREFGL